MDARSRRRRPRRPAASSASGFSPTARSVAGFSPASSSARRLRARRLPAALAALPGRQLPQEPRPRRAGRDPREGQGVHALAARAGLGARPGRLHRAHPRDQAQALPRGQPRRREGRRSPSPTSRPSTLPSRGARPRASGTRPSRWAPSTADGPLCRDGGRPQWAAIDTRRPRPDRRSHDAPDAGCSLSPARAGPRARQRPLPTLRRGRRRHRAAARASPAAALADLWQDILDTRLVLAGEGTAPAGRYVLCRVAQGVPSRGSPLSRVETAVLVRVLGGEQQKAVAFDLGIAFSTTSKWHTEALKKLRLNAGPFPSRSSSRPRAGPPERPLPSTRAGRQSSTAGPSSSCSQSARPTPRPTRG